MRIRSRKFGITSNDERSNVMSNEPKKSVELTEKELESVVGGVVPLAPSKRVTELIEKTRDSAVETAGRRINRPGPNL